MPIDVKSRAIPEVKLDWPIAPSEALLSDKDRRHPRLRDPAARFAYRAP
jgi:dTDP-4-dehydrorhamnose 3,5-epimerase